MQKFRIRSYEDDFYAGTCTNGEQVILGLLCPHVVRFRFDAEGKLLGCELRDWKFPAEHHAGIYAIFDPLFRERLAAQIQAWQSELGLNELPIEVQRFFDDQKCVGIEMPDDEQCSFIFWWAKDYWMNSGGEVEST